MTRVVRTAGDGESPIIQAAAHVEADQQPANPVGPRHDWCELTVAWHAANSSAAITKTGRLSSCWTVVPVRIEANMAAHDSMARPVTTGSAHGEHTCGVLDLTLPRLTS